MKIRDRVLEVYSDNISTDRIVPTRLVTEVTPEKLAPIAMKDEDEKFHEKLDKGKIMVAGRNFGHASSREYAPLALEKNNNAPLRIILHHDHTPFDVAIASQEVYDRPLARDKSASFLKVRRRGLAFEEMSSTQSSALEYFIDNHTLGPI